MGKLSNKIEILIDNELLNLRKDFSSIHNYSDFIDILPSIIQSAEIVSKGFENIPTGQEKRNAVINIVNKHIDIKVIPEWLEGKAIGRAVDIIIKTLNRLIGNEWLDSTQTLPPNKKKESTVDES